MQDIKCLTKSAHGSRAKSVLCVKCMQQYRACAHLTTRGLRKSSQPSRSRTTRLPAPRGVKRPQSRSTRPRMPSPHPEPVLVETYVALTSHSQRKNLARQCDQSCIRLTAGSVTVTTAVTCRRCHLAAVNYTIHDLSLITSSIKERGGRRVVMLLLTEAPVDRAPVLSREVAKRLRDV